MSLNENYKRIKKIAEILDTQFTGPWGIRFGWDPLIGLIPVIGSLITRTLSIYIVYVGMRLSQGSWLLLFKMIFHILVEALFEMVPFLGSLFDVYYKANIKNIRLIDDYMTDQVHVRRQLKIHIGLLAMSLLIILLAMCIASYMAFKAILSIFG